MTRVAPDDPQLGVLLDSFLSKGTVTYLCGPVRWERAHYFGAITEPVVQRQRNSAKFQKARSELTGEFCLDPSRFVGWKWSDEEVGAFFVDVMLHFASGLVLLDDWEYSRGATSEVVLALERGLRCRTMDGLEIVPESALVCIEGSLKLLSSEGDQERSRELRSALQRRLAVLGQISADST